MEGTAVDKLSLGGRINIIISALALLVSGISAAFTIQSNSLKNESLAMPSHPISSCHPEYIAFAFGGGGAITLCWSVILTNNSEDRVSIISFSFPKKPSRGLLDAAGLFTTADEKPVDFPIVLDGGEARKLTLFVIYRLPDPVSIILNQSSLVRKDGLPNNLTLRQIQDLLIRSGTDLLGDKTFNPQPSSGEVLGYGTSGPPKSVDFGIYLTTGHGKTFSSAVHFP